MNNRSLMMALLSGFSGLVGSGLKEYSNKITHTSNSQGYKSSKKSKQTRGKRYKSLKIRSNRRK